MKSKRICILDYGSGNTGSVVNLLNRLNFDANISNAKIVIIIIKLVLLKIISIYFNILIF